MGPLTQKSKPRSEWRILIIFPGTCDALKKIMPVNITQQTICRVISQQILYFSQHFAENFCLENACCVMFTDICYHLTDMTFLRALVTKLYLGTMSYFSSFWDLWRNTLMNFGTCDRQPFLVPVLDRKAETLIALLLQWVHSHTKIISDCCAACHTIR